MEDSKYDTLFTRRETDRRLIITDLRVINSRGVIGKIASLVFSMTDPA